MKAFRPVWPVPDWKYSSVRQYLFLNLRPFFRGCRCKVHPLSALLRAGRRARFLLRCPVSRRVWCCCLPGNVLSGYGGKPIRKPLFRDSLSCRNGIALRFRTCKNVQTPRRSRISRSINCRRWWYLDLVPTPYWRTECSFLPVRLLSYIRRRSWPGCRFQWKLSSATVLQESERGVSLRNRKCCNYSPMLGSRGRWYWLQSLISYSVRQAMKRWNRQ